MLREILRRIGCTVTLSLISIILFAQATPGSNEDSVDSIMRSHDKIYVVMAVCVTILIVLFLYLARIDRKISKKERML
ncbi:MAG: CcmD family protein [Ginsengibacter sp.]